MIRKGQRNGSTYWYCNDCKRYSSGRKKPSQEAIFNRYSQGTFTIKQLSEAFGICPSSVKRKLKDYGIVRKLTHFFGQYQELWSLHTNFGHYLQLIKAPFPGAYF